MGNSLEESVFSLRNSLDDILEHRGRHCIFSFFCFFLLIVAKYSSVISSKLFAFLMKPQLHDGLLVIGINVECST